ncbi:ABC transporter permease subunit [Lapidilactobacillus mulanensis]|uniref:ABC transporter permease subunit n=1 Tax=Lapidilactobacillus mulanensis TaxID=2485999 RepID=A0ABW4DLA8_9LACO|nr:ABC transporter permease subunit [Lapidilactobacillus mulanensis]
MDKAAKQSKSHAKTAALLSIIPGLGQLYNKQLIKGIGFLIIAILYVTGFWSLFNMGFWGLFTLGTEVPRDNSIFLLAEGLIAVLILGIGLLFYYMNFRDAYQNGEKIDMGQHPEKFVGSIKSLFNTNYPYLLISPGLLLLIFTVIFPILFSFALAFTNYDLYHTAPAHLADWVGFNTFKQIFTVDIWRSTFFDVLGWTVIWTLVASTLSVTIGIFMAIVVHQKDLRLKKLWRTVLVLPWAVPGFVTILIFAGMFNDSFGAVNTVILHALGIHPVSWMTNAAWTKVALLFVQSWLGFPYIFVVTTGVLQSIPEDLYEAAIMDGATAWQKFSKITLPFILAQMAPIIITQYTFNFNNFNIIYLFNNGGPAVPNSTAGGTDILVSWIYKLTMQSNQYALAAALTILLSVFVIGIALWQFKRTNSFKEG